MATTGAERSRRTRTVRPFGSTVQRTVSASMRAGEAGASVGADIELVEGEPAVPKDGEAGDEGDGTIAGEPEYRLPWNWHAVRYGGIRIGRAVDGRQQPEQYRERTRRPAVELPQDVGSCGDGDEREPVPPRYRGQRKAEPGVAEIHRSHREDEGQAEHRLDGGPVDQRERRREHHEGERVHDELRTVVRRRRHRLREQEPVEAEL